MNATTTTGAPYLRTIHTWRCAAGHELKVDDLGHPMLPGVKDAVVRCWARCAGDKCSTCGATVTYSFVESPVIAPGPAAQIESLTAEVTRLQAASDVEAKARMRRFGASYYATPRTKGGAVDDRANANKKARRA